MADKTANSSMIWQTAGGDPTRRGWFDREVHLRPHPVRALLAQGAIHASVVFDGKSRALVVDLAGGIQAFSPQGDLLWRVKLTGGVSATPVVHPAKAQVFLGTHAGSVLALDTTQGTILWTTAIPTQSDPRILSDLLYLRQTDTIVLSSWGGRFHALEAVSGAARFSWEAGLSPGAAAAADHAGMMYCLRAVANRGVELIRVAPTGEESLLYRAPEDRRGARRALVASAPVLDEDRGALYFVINRDLGSLLHAWSLKLNRLLWSQPLTHAVQATPALRKDGAILLADLAGFVNAIGPDGAFLFRYHSGCEFLLAGGVTEAGGDCYIGDPCGVLHTITSQGRGKPIFEAKRSIEARPSFDSSGNLYLPSTDRTVYVFTGKQ
jgi:hypothetical protein